VCDGSSDTECQTVGEGERSSGGCALWYVVHRRCWMQTFQLHINRVKSLPTLPLQTDQFRCLTKLSAFLRARSANLIFSSCMRTLLTLCCLTGGKASGAPLSVFPNNIFFALGIVLRSFTYSKTYEKHTFCC